MSKNETSGGLVYRVRRVPYDDGFTLGVDMLELLGAPAVEALGAAFDKGELGKAVQLLPDILRKHGGPAMVRRILAFVDVELTDPTTGEAGWKSLEHRLIFDSVLSGRYLESLELVAAVVSKEFAPVFRAGSEIVSARFGPALTTAVELLAGLTPQPNSEHSDEPS